MLSVDNLSSILEPKASARRRTEMTYPAEANKVEVDNNPLTGESEVINRLHRNRKILVSEQG